MALNITGTIELDNGLSLSSCYARTYAELSEDGKSVVCYPTFWSSVEAYNQKLQKLRPIFSNQIPPSVAYDRTTDGVDILLYSNEYIKFQLESLGFSVVITDL